MFTTLFTLGRRVEECLLCSISCTLSAEMVYMFCVGIHSCRKRIEG
jgi:hypothetical protein